MSSPATSAGRGWWPAHRWLVLRRLSQLFFLALFLAGPLAGWWVVKGTLAGSRTLDVLPLTDPLVALQSLLAGHALEGTALLGAVLVVAGYVLVGGRVYCSWVCPINPLTDLAHWLHHRFGLPEGLSINRRVRLAVLAGALAASTLAGTVAWELVNPVTVLHRWLVFGSAGLAWGVVAAVFLLDLAVARRGWCGGLCPVGAFYGLIGRFSLIRMSAKGRAACTECGDCYRVCPEPHVLPPVLRGAARGAGPVILSGDCTNCGRCADVCAPAVFSFVPRWDRRETHHQIKQGSTVP